MIVGSMDTFIDFGERAAIMGFTQGCNFNCWFCSNSKLKVRAYEDETEQFLAKIQKGLELYEGVVITGGEPCVWGHQLIELLRLIKQEFELPVKLDTNGSYYEILNKILDEKLVHTVALEIKADVYNFERMSETIGREYTLDDCNNIIKSANRLKRHDVYTIFRTTLIPTLNEVEFVQIIRFLIPGWNDETCEYQLHRYDAMVSEQPFAEGSPNIENYEQILRAYKVNFQLKNF